MDGEPPEELSANAISMAISRAYGIDTTEIAYLPRGAGGYLWVVRTGDGDRFIAHVDDLDAKPWISGDREPSARGLERAYATAATLRDKAHLEWVVGPIRTSEGNVVVSLTPRYCCALFPFVEGTAGSFGDVLTDKQRHERLGLLAELHQATETVRDGAPSLELGVAGRGTIDAAFADLGASWDTGPLAETARQLLLSHERQVTSALASFDQEWERVQGEDVSMVVTHGEPHPGNFMQGDSCRLIDWDTVGLASPERDLWMFDDGTGTTFDGYIERTGYRVDMNRISLYRMMWTLSDIAAFTADLRSPHGDTVNARFSLWALDHAVKGTASPPYRFSM